jgi:P4 family phage/plasmid primase-like protien
MVGLIKASISGAHYDVARVVHHMYRYDYVCSNIRNRDWYEYRDHRWRECDSAYSLRRKLSTDVFKEYIGVKQTITQRAMISDDEAEQKDLVQQSKKLAELALKLKITGFKDNVIKECTELFYEEKFESKLDSDLDLLCFENGVYDLANHEFRDGRPDDHCSFSTGINCVPHVPDHPVVREILRFWETVQPVPEIREYVLMTLASCLSGHIKEERFHIWTGSGCHAPGTRLLTHRGADVLVEDVAVGDALLGDDGAPRRVLRLFRGSGAKMYSITPHDAPDEAFVVNGDHVLSLVVCGAAAVRPSPTGRGFDLAWLEAAPRGSPALWAERAETFDTYNEAVVELRALQSQQGARGASVALRNGDVLDVTVDAYLEHLHVTGGSSDPHLQLFRPRGGVGSPDLEDYDAEEVIEVQDRMRRAYEDGIFMMTICAGGASGASGASGGVANPPEVPGVSEPRDVRRAFLAGILDGSGVDPAALTRGGVLATPLAHSRAIRTLFRSLGLGCRRSQARAVDRRRCWVALDARGTPASLLLDAASPPGLVRRGGGSTATLATPETPAEASEASDGTAWVQRGAERVPAWTRTEFDVAPAPAASGDFFGFELDGNHRYVMADSLVVTHNSNGKSLSVSLFEKTLGQYCCKFPVTLLTQKRAASSAATPEIARAKGRRFAVLQEPSEDERLNVGQLKELSGGDTVQTRELFKAPCEWRPQFKLFLLCNQLPHVPSDDGGTWRRIRVVEFASKFVERPNPEHPTEFPMDMELPTRINGWKEHFMALLLNVYYKRYAVGHLSEPLAVLSCTRDYQRTNDHMADFVDTCIEHVDPVAIATQQFMDATASASSNAASGIDPVLANNQYAPISVPTPTMMLDDAFAELKEWIKTDQIPLKGVKKGNLQKYLDRTLAKSIMVKGRPAYRGYRVRDRFGNAAAAGGGDDDDL